MYSAHVLRASQHVVEEGRLGSRTDLHFMEKGAMRRTTCCLFFAFLPLGIFDGSKSGGKYLLITFRCGSQDDVLWSVYVCNV